MNCYDQLEAQLRDAADQRAHHRTSRLARLPKLRRMPAVAVIAGCTVAVGVVAVGLLPSSSRTLEHEATTPATTPAPAEGSDHYSVLDGATGDAIAGWQVTRTPDFEALDLGLDLSRARVIYQDRARTIAAVATKGTPCLLTRYPNGRAALGCSVKPDRPTAHISHTVSLGLVPDSTKSVTYTMTNGDVVTEHVVDNVWRAPAEATKVQFDFHGQMREMELLPRSSLPASARIVDDEIVQDNAPQGG